MSTTINNYSQFYKGTQQVNSYGSGQGKKNTVVRYEFNTTDEDGNKVMDKMSRDESMRVMKDISSQYGNDVIVEFSGDGLAALAEKGTTNLPEDHTPVPEEMKTYLSGPKPMTEEEIAAAYGTKKGDDMESLMKRADPDANKEYQSLQKSTDMFAGFRYMSKWISNKAQSDPNWIDKLKDKEEVKSSEYKLSSKAKDYLEALRKQYGDYDFIIVDKGDDFKGLVKQSNKEISVIFSSAEIERMANDEDYAAEKMRRVKTVEHMTQRIMDEYGFESAWGKENGGGIDIGKMTVSFDDDGKMSIFAELEKISEKQKEHIEAAKERRAEEKEAAEKKAKKGEEDEKSSQRIEIKAESVDELWEKIQNTNWNNGTSGSSIL